MKFPDRFQVDQSGGVFFWTAWYAVSVALIVLAPSFLRFRQYFWNLDPADILKSLAMGMSFLAFNLFVRLLAGYRRLSLLPLFGGTVVCFFIPWFLTYYSNIPTSRIMFLVGTTLSVSLSFLPFVLGRFRVFGLSVLPVIAVAGALAFDPPESKEAATTARRVTTNYYALNLSSHAAIIPPAERGAGGAIARHGAGFILVTATGEFYRLNWEKPAGDSLKSVRLSVNAPFNLKEFLHDQPETAAVFRITDLVVDARDELVKLYVSHHHWNRESRCITMRVSGIKLNEASLEDFESSSEWATIFESKPCLAVASSEYRADTNESGGALALLQRGLLLSLGDNGIEGLDGEQPFAQRVDVSYGKVVFLDLAGNSKIFSMGHRNPQGLFVDDEGQVWEAEHGPLGGDELNLLVEGGNYGWPLATYGTDYGLDHWPLAPESSNHQGFREPVYAFVPSVATSQLIKLGSEQFPMWAGDLLIASLRDQTLFRVKMHEDRVVYVERILVGSRIRDLAQGSDGRIVLWTDRGEIKSLSRASWVLNGEHLHVVRCAPCHEPAPGRTTSAAPSLRNILGRRVASVEGYPYSNALQKLGGVWTKDRLDSFLRDPLPYAPGTSMGVGGVPADDQRAAIMRFLSSYK